VVRRPDPPDALLSLPPDAPLEAVAEAASGCTNCPLYRDATATVFGEGPAPAPLLLVGEQPGDQEDRQGRPFVGPAGRLLDEALAEAGVVRSDVYVTNAVKHFKWTPRGTRRIHQRPSASEVSACLPWLEVELDRVAPQVVVGLGATAARALLGPSFRMSRHRGDFVEWDRTPLVTVTLHPSAVLRAPDPGARAEARAGLVSDLAMAVAAVASAR
jgi:uracil-DNA glycosylase family protein